MDNSFLINAANEYAFYEEGIVLSINNYLETLEKTTQAIEINLNDQVLKENEIRIRVSSVEFSVSN